MKVIRGYKAELGLSERTYMCEECGLVIDRDLNAAIILRSVAVGSTDTLNACGQDVRLGISQAVLVEAGTKQENVA